MMDEQGLEDDLTRQRVAEYNMRPLACRLLYRLGGVPSESDVAVLARDLTLVYHQPRIDHCSPNASVEEIFLNRIGGIGALGSYLKCIRPKGAR